MNPLRVIRIIGKDLRLGPRSPIFLWALVFPVAATLVLQLVFGSLFAPQARLGIVDEGASAVTAGARAIDGIELTLVDSADRLRELVRAHDLDAGLVLPAEFDERVRAGERPLLQFYVSGQSLASNRLILAVTTLDLVRAVEGSTPPVDVDVVSLGAAELPLAARLTPVLVLFSLVIAGMLVPAFSLVGERESGTLTAVLVTPTTIAEVLVAKAALGFALALPMAAVTLALNGAVGPDPLGLAAVLVVGALVLSELGLVYGTVAKDAKVMFTLMKSLNIVLFAPVLFYVFPDWPQWIARLFPTYWVINPIFEVTILETPLAQVAWQLVVAIAIGLVAAPAVAWLGRRMQAQLAAG